MQKYKASGKNGALRQGEIISGLVHLTVDIENLETSEEEITVNETTYTYAVVATQDCDLEQDFRARETEGASVHRLLPNILFCEVVPAEKFYIEYPVKAVTNKGTTRNNLEQNKDERFQFFEAVPSANDSLKQGLPKLIVEFKRYFTIPTEEVYYRIQTGSATRRCQLRSPYLEHFSVRYHYYHYRVALPEDHLAK